MMRGIGAGGTAFRGSRGYRPVLSNAHAGWCSRGLGTPQEDLTESAVRLDLGEKERVIAARLTLWGLARHAPCAGHRGWPQIRSGARGVRPRTRPHSRHFGNDASCGLAPAGSGLRAVFMTIDK